MYLLEMIEYQGYEGTFTRSLVVSKNKKKLDILSISLKDDLINLAKEMNNFRNYLDNKYSSIRIMCKRTNEEIIELNKYEENLKLKYKNIFKYNIFDSWFSAKDIEFEVKKIKLI